MTKIAYLDCGSGISGDMTLAALIDIGVGLDNLNQALGSLNIPGLALRAVEVKRRGFRAIRATVEAEPEHEHRSLRQIRALIDGSRLSERQKNLALRIFNLLGKAESRVHGIPLEQVHFHEVGAFDSIADVVGSAVGWDLLGVDRVAASPVPTGRGTIRIAHGECTIPAPATAELLHGVPLVKSPIEYELTTPTGAAILVALAESFGPMPAMKIKRIGYGAGKRDFPQRPNILRLLVGEAVEDAPPAAEDVCIIETNLDDERGEIVAHCIARLWQTGALDVYTTPIGMKKDRPAVKLSVVCRPGDAALIEDVLFAETTTLGIRRISAARTVLRREPCTVETPWGPVAGVIGWRGDGSPRFSPEYEACRRAAMENDVPLRDVYEAAAKAFAERNG
ncbi:MAG: nickel pincer cofactor biosynthesis protein LarC [Pirellulaceae bacterium]|nr:nickel pincer cofactor biosynthesis protein LarC [Pirellulaceae bacterium]